MFKKVILKNYKSFESLEVDFTGVNKQPKKSVFIYGENGSGKSNIISAFSFLKTTFHTLKVLDIIDKLLNDKKSDDIDIRAFLEYKQRGLTNLLKDVKMINSTGNIELVYEFTVNNNDGIYKMVFNDNEIIEEELKFVLEKNLTTLFKIDDNVNINPKLIKDIKYLNELKTNIKKYFGKHTFMSIIYDELSKNNSTFMKEKINNRFNDVIHEFMDFSVLCNFSDGQEGHINQSKIFLKSLDKGTIGLNEIDILRASEEVLDDFFTSLYSDIKKVYYELKEEKNTIKYKLYFKKKISGETRNIPYDLESTGTIKILEIFTYLFKVLQGKTVLIDEIDSGIHDLLIVYLIKNVKREMSGQLIVTTHNTTLLKNLNPEDVYVLNIDSGGYKEINAINKYGDRIQKNHNLTDRYLGGIYGGVPIPGYLDLNGLVKRIEGKLGDDDGKKIHA